MKRNIVLIRHAKSSWTNPLHSDFERTLNERGEYDAPMMGERLKKLNLRPDLIISSSAKRAKQTAKRIAAAIGFDKEKIKLEDKLYHCIPAVFGEMIVSLDDSLQTVFIVAHNPGITDFVNELSNQFRIDNMPTCGVVAAAIDSAHWSDFNVINKDVFLFEYPKKSL
ncbi:MAG TPA: histidine phosphatase family protein [Flavipsychrobacter sp.]|nr:histidine phosphatase family protein [Flavipsychrobacter sp.]